MPYSIYDASIVNVGHILDSLEAILKKAESQPNSASFPEARIHPDMLPLTFQVHIVTLFTLKIVGRLSGTEPGDFPNDLKTFADFYKRIGEAKAELAKADRKLIESRVDETITFPMGPMTFSLDAAGFVNGFALPNMYFHLSTAYNILRKEGVPLGKQDYLTPFITSYGQPTKKDA